VPVSARLVADLLETAGANRVLTMDLHSPQIQGFFSVPVDNLMAQRVFADYVGRMDLENITVISPDAGGVGRAKWFAKLLEAELGIIDKRRPKPNVAQVFNVIGEVAGRDVVILDDMIDTAGTLVQSVEALLAQGARQVCAAITHPVLSGRAADRINSTCMEKLIVTNTIPVSEESQNMDKIEVLSVAALFGEAIRRIHEGSSVSSLFTE
jgi:ribose-phosphate pyrophosphokinase